MLTITPSCIVLIFPQMFIKGFIKYPSLVLLAIFTVTGGDAIAAHPLNLNLQNQNDSININGVVLDENGVALSGVKIIVSGGTSAVAVTSNDGRYSIPELQPGANYTVTANLSGYLFAPSVRSFTNIAVNQIVNFRAAPVSYSITGVVKAAGSTSGVSGVPVLLGGTRSRATVSGTDGSYIFASLPVDGDYTVSVSYGTQTFTPFLLDAPTSHSFYHLTGNLKADFTATPLINTFERLLSGVEAGDFNRDGKPDVVVGSATTGIHLLLGKGNGTFDRAANYNLNNGPTLVYTDDLNGDGVTDVVVGNGGLNGVGHSLAVLLGNGDGTLQIKTTIPTNASVQSIASSDFDGDGRKDLVVAVHGVNANGSSVSKVSILLGNGDGTFRSTVNYEGGFYLRSVIGADFNGDGKPDLAFTNWSSVDNIKILLNRGDGTFSAFANYTGNSSSGALAAGDFNADGRIDLAVGTGILNSNELRILGGNGDGTFQSPLLFDAGAPPNKIKVGDLNGDGKPDLVVLNEQREVFVLQGTGNGTFMSAVNYDHSLDPYSYSFGIALADFNNDGKLDLSISGHSQRSGGEYGAGHVGTMLNSPTQPAPAVTYSITGQVRDNNGAPISGASIIFGGRQSGSTVTDTGGNYILSNIIAGTEVSVTPVKPFYSFTPQARVVISDANKAGIDFTASKERYTISGQIKERGGNGLANSIVTLSGGASGSILATVSTDGVGNYSFTNVFAGDIYTIAPARSGYGFTPSRQSLLLVSNRENINFIAYPQSASVQFSAAALQPNEVDGRATFTVVRTGDTIGTASVDYRTEDSDTYTVSCADTANNNGGAFGRCDFATTVGTLSFAAGETAKTITVPIINDGHVEGTETFQLRLSNPTGAALGAISTTTVTIQDNDTAGAPNPIVTLTPGDFPFFVRQQYLDFLSREPEPNEPWTAVMNRCANVNTGPTTNTDCDRIAVSGAFFGSPEFRLKGFYVFRFYKLAFNRLPQYTEITSDMSFVAGATSEEVYGRKAQLATAFAARPEFQAAYGGLSNADYVQALTARAGTPHITTFDPANPDGTAKMTLTSVELINRLNSNVLTRAQVLRAIADSDEVGTAEYNNAFVAVQYYGYLRRTPDDSGYQAWLRVINQDPNNVRIMINGFMNSAEYRLRFGHP